jgi:hypothetical protein
MLEHGMELALVMVLGFRSLLSAIDQDGLGREAVVVGVRFLIGDGVPRDVKAGVAVVDGELGVDGELAESWSGTYVLANSM